MSYDVYKTKVLKRPLEILLSNCLLLGFPGGTVVKNLSANAGNTGLIPGSGRKIPYRMKWQPTPVFCLGNPMVREALWATVHGVTKETDIAEQLNNSNNNHGYVVSKKHRVEESEIPGP